MIIYIMSFKAVSFPVQCILISSVIQYTPAHYGDYTYPVWAEVVGWGISLVSIVWIPLGAIQEIYNNKGSLLQVSTGHIIQTNDRIKTCVVALARLEWAFLKCCFSENVPSLTLRESKQL